jgi:RNA recognition motif-containing protein
MRIFVGQLPRNLTIEQLSLLFSSYGDVTEARIANIEGNSQGYGFIVMPDAAEAQKAITHMNQHDLGGHILTVRAAKKQ